MTFKKGNIPWSKGKQLTEDHKRNLSDSHKNQIPWNKGKKTGIHPKTEFKKGQDPWHKGKGIIGHPAWKGFRETKNRRSIFRRILLDEIGKCERCGFDNKWALIVHHKDGNGKNNKRENLEMICANCHYIEHKGTFTRRTD